MTSTSKTDETVTFLRTQLLQVADQILSNDGGDCCVEVEGRLGFIKQGHARLKLPFESEVVLSFQNSQRSRQGKYTWQTGVPEEPWNELLNFLRAPQEVQRPGLSSETVLEPCEVVTESLVNFAFKRRGLPSDSQQQQQQQQQPVRASYSLPLRGSSTPRECIRKERLRMFEVWMGPEPSLDKRGGSKAGGHPRTRWDVSRMQGTPDGGAPAHWSNSRWDMRLAINLERKASDFPPIMPPPRQPMTLWEVQKTTTPSQSPGPSASANLASVLPAREQEGQPSSPRGAKRTLNTEGDIDGEGKNEPTVVSSTVEVTQGGEAVAPSGSAPASSPSETVAAAAAAVDETTLWEVTGDKIRSKVRHTARFGPVRLELSEVTEVIASSSRGLIRPLPSSMEIEAELDSAVLIKALKREKGIDTCQDGDEDMGGGDETGDGNSKKEEWTLDEALQVLVDTLRMAASFVNDPHWARQVPLERSPKDLSLFEEKVSKVRPLFGDYLQRAVGPGLLQREQQDLIEKGLPPLERTIPPPASSSHSGRMQQTQHRNQRGYQPQRLVPDFVFAPGPTQHYEQPRGPPGFHGGNLDYDRNFGGASGRGAHPHRGSGRGRGGNRAFSSQNPFVHER
uniref:mRNA 5'-phosphatase n=1 Tax=Chromera velia CCMP2878 TaxID=1169474 RepID=A0A0G4FEE9_9ALVE|eukprot:Cvel_16588.t1-p1 / transcript=Cvel_16588.t1 / gene=Cvel_16588 / organism=Chromera_velia_CCMP2878 / gene_product=hypothetical protein / transcript_product=hypothetical protein / location=Cvel_scaffold1284:27465-33019(-) / protein_length=621 / sequence_SO=supercontig / SO=protein_coding / is_pseudo=false